MKASSTKINKSSLKDCSRKDLSMVKANTNMRMVITSKATITKTRSEEKASIISVKVVF